MLFRVFLLTSLFAISAVPQEPQTTFRTGVSVVVAPTLVMDKDGSYINGLQPSDFRLTDNGKEQNIKVDVSYVPISMVVAVQANADVDPVLPSVRKIGSMFQGAVTGDQGEVAILAFDHRIELKQDFTGSTDKLEEALKSIKAGSSSSRMLDAVIQACRMLQKRPENRRKVVLLISETRDNGSEARMREALDVVQISNVVIYPVDINRFMNSLRKKPPVPRPDTLPPGARPLPAGVPMTPSSTAQLTGTANFVPLFAELFRGVKSIFVDNPSEAFAKFTGGKQYPFISQRDLERSIQEIGGELHAQYLISYIPNNREEGGFHEIEVSITRPGLRNVETRTRPGYWIAARP
jgi:VWFA-related protein